MTLRENVSEALVKLRKSNNRSAHSMAKALHTDIKQIWRLENKKANYRLESIERYAAALGCSVKLQFEKLP